jgi:hypothetical protein
MHREPQQTRRLAPASAPGAAETATVVRETPQARAARAWSLPTPQQAPTSLPLPSSDVRAGGALGFAAILPAFGFLLGVSHETIVSAGVLISGCMLMLALRPAWRFAAWAGVATGAIWVLVGFALAVGRTDSVVLSASFVATSALGHAFAYRRKIAPGAVLSLIMGASSLVLAMQTDMAGPPGAAFAGIVLLSALVGAANLRLEGLHVAAFVAALVGLFILSGQESAAVWFTPAAAWAGAAFLAISVVRVPQLGPRAVTLAGTGALAPFAAITTLSAARHGLAGGYTTAGAFIALAAILAGVLILSANRRGSRLSSLGATLWILAFAAAISTTCAIIVAAPAPVAAAALAASALLLIALDARAPHLVWRILALAFAALAALFAAIDAQLVLSESTFWPAWVFVGVGIATPSLLGAVAAWRAQRNGASLTGGVFEFLAIALGIVAASLMARLVFTAGATRLHPLDFVEASAHISIWLAASLMVAANARGGAYAARIGASAALGVAALGASALAGLLWLTPYWTGRDNVLALPDGLGFLVPGVLFGAHWVFWRARGSRMRTRFALGACAAMMAAFVTFEVSRADNIPDWLAALSGALAFALAIAINFAPGVALDAARRRYLRDRRAAS